MEDWIVRAECDPADTSVAAADALAVLTSGHGAVSIDVQYLDARPERHFDELSVPDATALIRAELMRSSFIAASFWPRVPSERPIGLIVEVRGADYAALQAAPPLKLSANPRDLESADDPEIGHTDFDYVMLGLASAGEGVTRVTRALCGLEGGLVPNVCQAYAAYHASAADLARSLGIDVDAADLIAALELAAAELPRHRRVNARVTRVGEDGVLLSLTPFSQTRHTAHTLRPLVAAARVILGA